MTDELLGDVGGVFGYERGFCQGASQSQQDVWHYTMYCWEYDAYTWMFDDIRWNMVTFIWVDQESFDDLTPPPTNDSQKYFRTGFCIAAWSLLFLGFMFCVGKNFAKKSVSKFVLGDADVTDKIFRFNGYSLHDFLPMKKPKKRVDIPCWYRRWIFQLHFRLGVGTRSRRSNNLHVPKEYEN